MFSQSPYKKFAYEATQTIIFSTKIATRPLVPPHFSRSAAFSNVKTTFEVEMSAFGTVSFHICFIFVGNSYELSSSCAGPAAFFVFHRI